ncbi:hypothetical protein [Streptomyces mirabilis]|uniref:hypothetical protein n=1 Tax=Streptomyces mirabilis TaxID=68239 RepID=UPI0033345F7D
MDVSLRELQDSDLPFFWEQLTDPVLQQMAAVTRKYHYDRGDFHQHWAKVRSDASVLLRTVLVGGVDDGLRSGWAGFAPWPASADRVRYLAAQGGHRLAEAARAQPGERACPGRL